MSKLLLGQTLDSQAIIDFKRYLYPYQFEADESTNAAIVRYNANATYRAEEMVAFVLTYADLTIATLRRAERGSLPYLSDQHTYTNDTSSGMPSKLQRGTPRPQSRTA